ncbi:hypothetical protein B0T24DRAFT_692862 [Lasiosphaeria ovina]|uniref:Uncharacterized protein n=1 Tax=Lasiosphaeria ovina TaxID=92902 RepID=A0AAE0MXR1_9PEZI|nr:hypothetical protein B0T24DRAFT_692862 [Lasiosphaeria ovina]
MDFDDEKSPQIFLLASLFTGGYARNNSSFLRDVLGLYMLANGTPRRVIETLVHIGLIPLYWTLNRMLNEMADRAKENIKKVARDPNSIVVYDNFNFMSRIRELVGGKKDEMINLITACIVSCPELGGAVQKANFRPRTKITKRMIVDYILPRRETVNNTSKWLVKQALMKIFIKNVPDMPIVKRVKYNTSLYLQLGAIFEDEGTIDGVYKLYEELFKRRYSDLAEGDVINKEFRSQCRLLQYIEILFIIHEAIRYDIKYNKNSTHDMHATFSRLALNGNFLATIRKSVETLFESKQKGTHKAGDPTADIISYACKLYNDGITKRNNKEDRPEAFDAPDVFERGQQILLEKLDNFNKAIVEPKDLTEQRLVPGTVLGGTEDGEINWGEEGLRLFDAEDDFWVQAVDLTGD